MSEYYHFQTCCCLHLFLFVFVVLFVGNCCFVCWYLLFEKKLWKPGDPEENHIDHGEDKGGESESLEGTRL